MNTNRSHGECMLREDDRRMEPTECSGAGVSWADKGKHEAQLRKETQRKEDIVFRVYVAGEDLGVRNSTYGQPPRVIWGSRS